MSCDSDILSPDWTYTSVVNTLETFESHMTTVCSNFFLSYLLNFGLSFNVEKIPYASYQMNMKERIDICVCVHSS